MASVCVCFLPIGRSGSGLDCVIGNGFCFAKTYKKDLPFFGFGWLVEFGLVGWVRSEMVDIGRCF